MATEKIETAMPLADEVAKLLDNEWCVVMYKHPRGGYAACAIQSGAEGLGAIGEVVMGLKQQHITDDFTPSKALHRLVEKVLTRRIVEPDDGE